MTLFKLSSLATRLSSRQLLLQRFNLKQPKCTLKTKGSTHDEDADDVDDKPIQYSTSPAAEWAVKYSQVGGKNEMPWFQPYSVALSTGIFLIYFLYLREPNDIDEIFEMELGDHFPNADINALSKTLDGNVDIGKQIK